ncbi:MAG: ABC transporter ATP-binding protein [Aphanocapsa feldmannii 277cV]|uniref:ABC transporter ATP-binding protein n=1 Tax=Aphanocapsa feldmannii 277cV TaxID=2507553 RepID=A0A524RKV3_9CHRO|nr:MAG: ABC transporter ATP-binding protein [Aphanocapsa feldmannii 288cV]TGG90497.1 MAG: ABC transporter ATP-binding protein [Aphanocapsa feldmannii 277cV]
MLELDQLRYQPATAEQPVLRGGSLRLRLGEAGVVSGPSGAGKSTLLELVSGLAQPDAGVIRWQGEALSRRQRRWLCGMVFQFPERHFLGLTLGQELRLAHRRLSQKAIDCVLDQVGLSRVPLTHPPERLSGGQQRRLALAVQLLRNPAVLLLDEPTAGLDWSVRGQLVELLQSLGHDRVLLVVTHEPELFGPLQPQRHQLRKGLLSPL